jgi:A/G-specific adenine glycosylase
VNFISLLQKWYKNNKRLLPWRETRSPYNIWISEIIFQQTRINQGHDYYLNFVKRFPDIEVLANASEDEVLNSWQGLGYYSRAHNLHFTAKYISRNLNGVFPATYDEIIKLKGIGKYTAAAIASISFNEKTPAIDGNAFRVYSRIFCSEKDISKSSTFKYFFDLIKPLMPENPGDFNQAIMDFGSLVCTPLNPKCNQCIIQEECLAYKNNSQNVLPVKSSFIKIKEEKIHYAYLFYKNLTLIKKRNNNSIWKGLYEFPLYDSNFKKYGIIHNHRIKHKLSHRFLTITISEIEIDEDEFYQVANKINAIILNKNNLKSYAFPKPMENFLFYN